MEQKYYLGTLILAVLLLGVWGASVAGWFRLPDLMLYDGLVRFAPEQKLASKKILLIEASPEEVFSKNSAWLSLNKKLGIQVVAEGIEEEEQLKTLQKMNCHLGQGFLFSWPLSTQEIEHYFSQSFSCCLSYDPSAEQCPN